MDAMHELRTLLARHGREGSIDTAVKGLTLYASAERTEPIPVVYEPTLCLMLDGAKQIAMEDRIYRYEAGDHLTVSVDLPVRGHVTLAPYSALSITLDPATIAGLTLDMPDAAAEPPAEPLTVHPADPELLDAVLRLVRLLDRPAEIPVLAPMIRREIHWRLLQGPGAAMVRQMGMADSRLARISRVLNRLREDYAAPVRIEALADLAGMSLATFHRHFKAVTGMSPLQYQKRVRLVEARARLLVRESDVAGVGFSVGYDSPSQFSREYARLFGAPPGRDQARLRAASSVERAVA